MNLRFGREEGIRVFGVKEVVAYAVAIGEK